MNELRPLWKPPWNRSGRAGLPVLSSLAVACFQVAGTVGAGQRQPDRVQLDALGYVLLLLGPAALLLRRRHPAAVMAGTTAVTIGYLFAGYPYGPVFVSLGVAFFVAVQCGQRRAAWACGGAFYVGQLLMSYAIPYDWLRARSWQANAWQELGVAAVLLLIATGAELARVRREQFAAAGAAAEEAQRRRVDEERLRMARELHDILAHSISLIHVQAGVALELIDTRPEQARSALATIKAASKEALGEVRQVLGTLRGPGATAPRTPAPGLDRLDELVDQAGRAGLTVSVRSEGIPGEAPTAVQRAAFRIVQEALTNVIRHSAARTATVLLSRTADGLTVQIDDPGPVGGGDAGGSGAGLIGMRERVATFGGTLEAGPCDAGFRVRARLTRGDW
ncbi:sensor histidine kinase [Kitasatospora sp. NPDC058478]|uniref:sensor histidine kinase n=1 Tax=unclassified Kitasatospora TaxID=2633591 RepID=UPI0036619F01